MCILTKGAHDTANTKSALNLLILGLSQQKSVPNSPNNILSLSCGCEEVSSGKNQSSAKCVQTRSLGGHGIPQHKKSTFLAANQHICCLKRSCINSGKISPTRSKLAQNGSQHPKIWVSTPPKMGLNSFPKWVSTPQIWASTPPIWVSTPPIWVSTCLKWVSTP